MITRNFTLKPRANPALEFSQLNQEEIVTQLRKQARLSNEIVRVIEGSPEPKVSNRWEGRFYVSSR
ncbi:MAG: hypothetical protein WBV94_24575 [Blastocatellia bacterium]